MEEIGPRAFARVTAGTVLIPETCRVIGPKAFLNAETTVFEIRGRDTVLEEMCIGYLEEWGGTFSLIPEVSIHCFSGSPAEEYCRLNGISCALLDEEDQPDPGNSEEDA